jgi:hypothetical protein
MKSHLPVLLICAALLQLPLKADDLRVRVGSVMDSRSSNGVVGGGGLRIQLRLLGEAALQAHAARASVSGAVDDTGVQLDPVENGMSGYTQFNLVPGGFNEHREVWINLTSPQRAAKFLQSVTGKVDVFVPDNDPDATIVVPGILGKVGEALNAPALAQANAVVTVYDQAAFEKALENGDIEWNGGSRGLGMGRAEIVKAGDLAVAVADPRHRVMGVKFQTRDGQPLQVITPMGMSSSQGVMITVYQFPTKPTSEVSLVCYVLTPKSVVSVPLNLTNVPLP